MHPRSELVLSMLCSEAWGPPQFQEKRSWSEKAILGALGEFRGILGAALGIRNSILGIRNSILGMASHDLSNTKTRILGATPGAIPRIDGNPHERSFGCQKPQTPFVPGKFPLDSLKFPFNSLRFPLNFR